MFDFNLALKKGMKELIRPAKENALPEIYVPTSFNPNGKYSSVHQFFYQSEIKTEVQKLTNCLTNYINSKQQHL